MKAGHPAWLHRRDFRCEKRLIEEAHRINHAGKMLAPIIDDAHLIDPHDLRMRCTSSVLTRRAHAPQAPAHET